MADQEDVGMVGNLRRAGYLPSAVLTWLAATGGIFSFPDQEKAGEHSTPTSTACWSPDKRIEEMLDSVSKAVFAVVA